MQSAKSFQARRYPNSPARLEPKLKGIDLIEKRWKQMANFKKTLLFNAYFLCVYAIWLMFFIL